MKKVLIEVTDKGAVYANDTRITGRHTKWGIHNTVFTTSIKVPANKVRQILKDNNFGHIVLDEEYCLEFGI